MERDLTAGAGAPTLSLGTVKPRSRSREILRGLVRNKGALAGLIILIVMILGAVFAPLITTYDPIKIDPPSRTLPPSRDHWLGTDAFGRDIYTRIVYGGRVSLPVGLIAVAIAASVGALLGLIAGYYGRWADGIIMRLIDILLAFPNIMLALIIVAILGPNIRNVMIAVGVGAIPAYTRLIRGQVLSARELLYVEAAKVIGVPTSKIMYRHILPNVVSPVIVLGTLSVGTAILAAAGLSFLGLGAQPPRPEWGSMLADGRQFLRSHWWVATMPGMAIALTVLSINMFGDGLRDILDPRIRS
ncbi:MAG TPA: ABC transporter permease [Thermomicrobiales bacterium]|nr:ABC transporter permease [Thermomicrobiales bacterium]